MPFKKGEINYIPRKGYNKSAEAIRRAYAEICQYNIPKIQEWLERVAEKDPAKALYFHIEISKRFVPTLAHVQVEGEITHTIQAPTIIKHLDTGDNPQAQPLAITG